MGCGALWLASGVVLTMRLVPTGHLLFFASPKKRTLVSEKRMLRSAGRRGRGSSPKRLWWIDRIKQPEN